MIPARIPPQTWGCVFREAGRDIATLIIGAIGLAAFFAAVLAPIILIEAFR